MKLLDIPFCCACGKVQDDIQANPVNDPWIDLRSYNTKNGFHLDDIRLINTYCPDCAKFFENVPYENKSFSRMSQGA